ncbi:diacylglycerol/lipid kinase family protein [Salinarchaeum laminariae]|uniref:diacylglycerol/lipid kinase family protein n=1 Tax=Salinarchaeum laminariae TaxID=869888 RepID=UPI0020C16026|nr:diacylglycerol kinase family protein [Salinarchaeum laminariae]
MSPDAAPPASDGDRSLVLNPAAGDGQHTAQIYDLAGQYDFTVHETDSAKDIVETAAAVAPDASILAAAGGDGTLTRVVRGIDRADAFDDTTFGVVPAGTGNSFAGNVGVTGLEQAFEVMEHGDRRRVDLGTVGVGDGEQAPFLNSVVAGLTAESSADTDSASKERWGVLAYAMTTVQTASNFDALRVTIERPEQAALECEAQIVLIGNGRRFPRPGGSQANLEDGLLDVSFLEDASALELAGDSLRQAIGNEADRVEEFTTPAVSIEIDGPHSRISVDGEIESAESVAAAVRPKTLWLAVGDGYQAEPDGGQSA